MYKMSVTFHVFYDNKKKSIELKLDNTVLDLKKNIVNNLENIEYIDLDLKIDKPIRAFGKMNLEPGIFPRSMDTLTLSNYNIENREITCEVIIVNNYLPSICNENDIKKNNPSSIYKPPGCSMKESNMKNKKKTAEESYNIDSQIDFPTL